MTATIVASEPYPPALAHLRVRVPVGISANWFVDDAIAVLGALHSEALHPETRRAAAVLGSMFARSESVLWEGRILARVLTELAHVRPVPAYVEGLATCGRALGIEATPVMGREA